MVVFIFREEIRRGNRLGVKEHEVDVITLGKVSISQMVGIPGKCWITKRKRCGAIHHKMLDRRSVTGSKVECGITGVRSKVECWIAGPLSHRKMMARVKSTHMC
jgi:hypothetical protein